MSPREIATKVQYLLASVGLAQQHDMRMVADPIADPQGFIAILLAATRVTRFEFAFSVPNPPDDEKYAQRPPKDYGKRIGATEGKAPLKCPSLNAMS